MIALNLSEIAAATNGKLVGEDKVIQNIVTDSRALKAGELSTTLSILYLGLKR